MRWLDSITNSVDMNLCKLWEIVEVRGAWLATVHGVTKSWTRVKQLNVSTRRSVSHKVGTLQTLLG